MGRLDFSIDPAYPAQGLQFFGQQMSRRQEHQRAAAKEKQEQQKRQKAYNLMKTGTREQIEEFITTTPGAQKIFDEAISFKSESTKRDYIETARKIYLEGAEPVQALSERAQKVMQEGGDATETIEAAGQAIQDPNKGKELAMRVFQVYEPDTYKTIVGKAADKKGKPLKLEQLINKRNELPDGSDERGLYDQAIKKEVATSGQAASRPYISKLMAEGYVPSTRITGPMLDAYEAAAKKADEMGKPLTVDGLRKMEFNAVKNRSTGSAAGSRLVLARKQGIESAQGLLKDMKTTSDKLKYSDVKFVGALQKHLKGQLNDPDFTEYMTQRADSLFILGNVLKQNGLTDKSIEVEEEAFNPSLAPKAFKAWLNTQIRALNRAAQEMNRDYGYGITLLPAFDPGQGGAPTEAQPQPVIPAKNHEPATSQKAVRLSQGKVPVLHEFLQKALVANPGVSEQELTDYYNKKYGGR